MVTLKASGGSVPAREVSRSNRKRWVIDQPGPPYCFGHSGAIEDPMPQQHLLLGEVGLRVWNAHFRRVIFRDKSTHLVAKPGIFAGKL
jgi:hypothetical protein